MLGDKNRYKADTMLLLDAATANHKKCKNSTARESLHEEGFLESFFDYLKRYSYPYTTGNVPTELHKQTV